MLNKRLPAALRKFKVYSDLEFKALNGKEHRAERLQAAILDDREDMLNDTDYRYLHLLTRAYGILTNEIRPNVARKKVGKLLEVSSPARLRQIISDVNEVFCNIEERNKAITETMMINRISAAIHKTEKLDILSGNLPRLYALLGEWTQMGKDAGINPDDFQLPIPEYSTDINDLNEDVDDVEYVEV